MPPGSDRAGIALLLTVMALALTGMVALTLFTLARVERAGGLQAVAHVQARSAAETAIADAMLGWPSTLTPAIPGDSVVVTSVNLPGPARGVAQLQALGAEIFRMVGQGARLSIGGETLGSARIELLVLLTAPDSAGMVRPHPYPRGFRALP